MNGLQNIAGSSAPIDIDGRTYHLSPLTLRALGEVERRVIARRISPLDALADCIDRFSTEQQRQLIDRAVDATARLTLSATQAEVAAFLTSYEGICFFFYLSTRETQPEIDSPEAAQRLLDRLGPVDILRVGQALTAVAGLDALEAAAKKSQVSTDQVPAVGENRESPGRPSSAASPGDTAGRPSKSDD